MSEHDSIFEEFFKINANLDCEQLKQDFIKHESAYKNKSKMAQNVNEPINTWAQSQILMWLGVFHGSNVINKNNKELFLSEIISIVRRVVFLVFKFELRSVQLLSITALLNKKVNKGRLLQVSTGEGKSITIAALAAIKVLLGERVDIVTTSEFLAKRDSQKLETFYKMLQISVSNNIDEKDCSKSKMCYECNVVYGSAHTFQIDILFDEYNLCGTLNKRKPEAIIIDEVDSMFIDEYSRSTYLSQPKPGLEKLNFVFFVIWNNLELLNEDKCKSEETSKKIYNIIDAYFTNVIENEEVNINDRTPVLNMPDYLKTFVRTNLNCWIQKSVSARFHLKQNKDYLIEDGDIKPIDQENTGTIQTNTKYSNGLHQFLQIKHQLKMTDFSLITNYLSNIGFFGRYKNKDVNNICGLTGTLGSSNCKRMLDDVYRVDFVYIPTFKPKNFIQFDSLINENESEWLAAIHDSVLEKVKNKRAVLILAESINYVHKIQSKLIPSISQSNLIVYKRDDIEKLPEDQKLRPGQVIISTNLAGRGVDLKINDILIENGGLHVVLTFLSINSRVEIQAFGRASREGYPGSGQMILNYDKEIQITHLHSNQAKQILRNRDVLLQYEDTLEKMEPEILDFILQVPKTIEDFKSLRDEREKKHLIISKVLIDRIIIEDLLFEKFCGLLKEVTSNSKYKFKEFEKKLIRDAIEERWALWLINLKKDLSEEEASFYFEDFKTTILNDLDDKENRYKVIQNSYYIDQICLNALRGKETTWIKLLRHPLNTIKKKLITKEEYLDLSLDDIINLCNDSMKKNSCSFVPYMNKAVCLINKENESEETTNYADAIRQYEISEIVSAGEIGFWSYFQYILQNDRLQNKENKETIQMIEKKINLYAKIHDGVIKKNMEEIESAKKQKRKVNLIEIDIKSLLSCKDEINEMKLKGLESVFIIKRKVRKRTLAFLFVLSAAQIGIGVALLFTPFGFIGSGFLVEGVSDLFTFMYAAYTGEFDWKEYAIKKAISCLITGLFVAIGPTQFYLKKLPLKHVKTFVKQKVGKYIKQLVVKSTGSAAEDSILKSISFLSRLLLSNKKKKLPKKIEKSKYDEIAKNINRDMQDKIGEINRKYAERVNEIEQVFDQVNDDDRLNSNVNDIIADIAVENMDELIQSEAFNISTNRNEIEYQLVIENRIEDIRDLIGEIVLDDKQTLDAIDVDCNDKNELKQTLEKEVSKVSERAAKSLQIKLKNRPQREIKKTGDKLNEKIQDSKYAGQKKELIKTKLDYENSLNDKKQDIREYIKSKNIAQDVIDVAKNKFKDEITTNLMSQMKEDIVKNINHREIKLNAYTSNGDPNYEYTSLDIEYISTQLFKENVFASDVLLFKPVNKNSLEKTLRDIKLQTYNMLFYDAGDLNWVVYFIVKQNKQIDVLCKCLFKLDTNLIESIRSGLTTNYPDFEQNFYINKKNLDSSNEIVHQTGIHSLWNMKIIADEVINNRSDEFLGNFETYENWCIQDLTKSLRENEFAELFAISFLEVEFEKLILIEKQDLIIEHHKSQLNELALLLKALNTEKNIKFISESTKEEASSLENTVLIKLHVDSVCSNGLMNTVDYEYSYVLDFTNLKNELFKKSIKDEIFIMYSLAEMGSNTDLVKIPARNNTNNLINVLDKIKIPLYDQISDDDEEDSVFCVDNFLLVLAKLECENLALNENLATCVFKKTKFYDDNNRVSESFYKITRVLTETHKLMKKKKKMFESPAPNADENLDEDDDLESLDLEEEKNKCEEKRRNIIDVLRKSNIEPTEELVEKLLNS